MSIDAKKVFDKIQYLLLNKALNKMVIQGKELHSI